MQAIQNTERQRQEMEFYNPKKRKFETSHISFWTEDVKDATWLKKRSHFTSTYGGMEATYYQT